MKDQSQNDMFIIQIARDAGVDNAVVNQIFRAVNKAGFRIVVKPAEPILPALEEA